MSAHWVLTDGTRVESDRAQACRKTTLGSAGRGGRDDCFRGPRDWQHHWDMQVQPSLCKTWMMAMRGFLDTLLMTSGAPTHSALTTALGETLTYQALITAVEQAADTLREAGVQPGQIVAVDTRSAAAVLAMLAVLEAGATLMPWDGRQNDLGLLETARPVKLITQASFEGAITLASPCDNPRELAPGIGLLLFTSGSTGRPKGVLLSLDGLMANIDAILSYLPVRKFPRTALTLPLSYSYAFVGQALVTLRAGGTLLMMQDLPFPAQQLSTMRALDASGLSGVPTSLRRLCEAALDMPVSERPQLGYVASAGAPLDQATRERLGEVFPCARRFNQYGLTEASPRVAACSDQEPAFHAGSVGRPLPGLTVLARDPQGTPLPPGQTGTLWIQGPSIMRGYLDDETGSSKVLIEGGLLSGDDGWVDDAGYIFTVGRQDGLIKVAGERVSLQQVTAVIQAVAGVREAAVVARPDSMVDHYLVAFVAGDPGIITAIKAHVRAHLPLAGRPRRIVVVEHLPRNARDKLDWQVLQHLATEGGT